MSRSALLHTLVSLFSVALFACGGSSPAGSNGGSVGTSSGSGTATNASTGSSSGTTGTGSGATSGAGSSGTTNATSSGGPTTAAVASNTLPFGPVNCGATASPQSVTLTNTGAGAFTYTATLGQTGANAPFSITAGANGSVTSSNPATITIAPAAVPSSLTLPASVSDTLTITTTGASNDATPITVALSESAQGVILTTTISNVLFGSVPAGESQSANFEVQNVGNVSAPVTMSTTNASTFVVAPAGQQTVTTTTALSASVTFDAPSTPGAYSDTITFALPAGTASCQPLPTISLSGSSENGSVALSANSLDFGNVPCGADGGTQSFTLSNAGTVSYTYQLSLALGANSPFSLTCSPSTACGAATGSGTTFSGTLNMGDQATFTVAADPIPSVASTSSDLFGDTITVSTDVVGDTGHQVALTQTAYGAVLSFNPASLQLGQIPINTTTSQTFQVENQGNAPANVNLTPTNSPIFAVTPLDGGIPGGDNATFSAVFAPGSSTTVETSNVTLAVDATTILCNPLPTALALSGQGTNGEVAFTPSAVNFGLVNCGTQAGPQTVTFSNPGNQAYTITAALDAGTAYTLVVTPDGGVVAPGDAGSVIVIPNGIPQTSAVPGNYNDALTVTTTAQGDIAHVIPVTESAQGVILTNFAPATGSVDFRNTPATGESTYQLYVQNLGNVPAPLVVTSAEPTVFSFDTGAAATVPANGTLTFNGYFTPANAQDYTSTATFAVASGTVLCSALPPSPLTSDTLNLSGTGTEAGVFSASPTSVDFGKVACGATSTTSNPTVVTFSNKGAVAAGFSATTTTGAFTIDAGTDVVNANSVVKLALTANPVPSSDLPGPISDTLTITPTPDGGAAGSAIQIPITETVYGAVLSFSPSTITFSQCKGLTNTGTTESGQVVNSGTYTGNGGCANIALTIDGDGDKALSFSAGQTGLSCNRSGQALSFTLDCDVLTPAKETATIGIVVLDGGADPVCGIPLPTASVSVP